MKPRDPNPPKEIPKPNWSLLLVGIGPHPTVSVQKIVARFEELGHQILHASLILDGMRSEPIHFIKRGDSDEPVPTP